MEVGVMSKLISIREAAELLSVSVDTIRRLVREDHKNIALRVRGQYRIDQELLMEAVKPVNDDSHKIQAALKSVGYSISADQTQDIMSILNRKEEAASL
jgi:excisionase family DNA binding protein